MLMLVLCGGLSCVLVCVCVLLMQMVYNLAAEVY